MHLKRVQAKQAEFDTKMSQLFDMLDTDKSGHLDEDELLVSEGPCTACCMHVYI